MSPEVRWYSNDTRSPKELIPSSLKSRYIMLRIECCMCCVVLQDCSSTHWGVDCIYFPQKSTTEELRIGIAHPWLFVMILHIRVRNKTLRKQMRSSDWWYMIAPSHHNMFTLFSSSKLHYLQSRQTNFTIVFTQAIYILYFDIVTMQYLPIYSILFHELQRFAA